MKNMNLDLFGDSISAHQELSVAPLTLEQIESAMHVLPDFLLTQLENSVKSLRVECARHRNERIDLQPAELSGDNALHKLSAARKRFLSEMIWVFDLAESYFPFDVACRLASKPLDPDVIRNGMSVKFGDEIRLLYRILDAWDHAVAASMGAKLKQYVCLQ
jgi:hypothetical protein